MTSHASMPDEIHDADEIIDVTARQVVPFVPPPTVALAVSVDEALQQWQDYQRLTRELLDDSDFQQIGQKKFKKKSAWRKYARAFNITDRVTFEDIQRDERGFPLWARIRVEARATNGRTAEADHECHVLERCCSVPCPKSRWNNHDCCSADCDGKRHWSHPGDLPATALTRAKNRAIADLIGAGEVSAEEMTERRDSHEFERDEFQRADAGGARIPPRPRATANKASADARTAFWKATREKGLTPDQVAQKFNVTGGFGNWTDEQFAAALTQL